MTIFLAALVAILVLLVLIRISAKAKATVSSNGRPTRERRSGRDRRMQRVLVPRNRRKKPRRFEDVASAYVTRIDGPGARSRARG